MGGRGSSSASAKGGAASYRKYVGESVPFATVSRGQAGMIFAAHKRGDIDATKQQINMMYKRYARDKYESATPSTDSHAVDAASKLRTTVNAISANDYKAANAAFQAFLDVHYTFGEDMWFPDDRKKRR